jgi:hypothetical protein
MENTYNYGFWAHGCDVLLFRIYRRWTIAYSRLCTELGIQSIVLFKKDRTMLDPNLRPFKKDKMKKLELLTSDPEMQGQIEEFDLGQHVMGKKLSMSDNCSRMRRRRSIRWRNLSWDST